MSEEYIRGHRSETGITEWSDWFIPDGVINDVIKPFMTDKETSIDDSESYYISSANHKNNNK